MIQAAILESDEKREESISTRGGDIVASLQDPHSCKLQTTDMYAVADPYGGGVSSFIEEGVATATLTRQNDGIVLYLATKNLLSVWRIVYNDPSQFNNPRSRLGQRDALDKSGAVSSNHPASRHWRSS